MPRYRNPADLAVGLVASKHGLVAKRSFRQGSARELCHDGSPKIPDASPPSAVRYPPEREAMLIGGPVPVRPRTEAELWPLFRAVVDLCGDKRALDVIELALGLARRGGGSAGLSALLAAARVKQAGGERWDEMLASSAERGEVRGTDAV